MPFYYDRKTMRNFMRRRAGNKGLQMAWARFQEQMKGQAGKKRRVQG